MSQRKPKARKLTSTAADRLFAATFGRDMTAEERKKFIFEKAATLKELAEREERSRTYRFLRQT